jgi:hypothetical protein
MDEEEGNVLHGLEADYNTVMIGYKRIKVWASSLTRDYCDDNPGYQTKIGGVTDQSFWQDQNGDMILPGDWDPDVRTREADAWMLIEREQWERLKAELAAYNVISVHPALTAKCSTRGLDPKFINDCFFRHGLTTESVEYGEIVRDSGGHGRCRKRLVCLHP